MYWCFKAQVYFGNLTPGIHFNSVAPSPNILSLYTITLYYSLYTITLQYNYKYTVNTSATQSPPSIDTLLARLLHTISHHISHHISQKQCLIPCSRRCQCRHGEMVSVRDFLRRTTTLCSSQNVIILWHASLNTSGGTVRTSRTKLGFPNI